MSITNTIDIDQIVLSYVESSILVYMKTINSDFYNLFVNIRDNNKFTLTKALIETPYFLENNFDYIKVDITKLLTVCVKNKLNLDGLKWLYYIKNCKPDNFTFAYAAKNGNFDILKWMLNNNFPKNYWTFSNAAINGNLDILKWMLENNFPKDECTFARAVKYGNLDILKWMFDNNFPVDKGNVFVFGIGNGNLNILNWLLDKKFPKYPYAFSRAAKIGNFEILKWLLKNNFPKDEKAFVHATKNGNFDILKWMFDNNFPKDGWTFRSAVENGNSDIINWMVDNNFPQVVNVPAGVLL